MGGFLSSLSGGSARRAARHAAAVNDKFYTEGRDSALGEVDTGLEQSLGYLQPGIDSGNNARALYENAIGVNGQPAQQNYYDNFQNDPGFQAEVDYGLDQTQRQAVARGNGYSGRTLGALADRAQIHQRSAFQNRLGHLSSLSQIGQQGSNTAAGLTTNAYNKRADLDFGTAQLRANGQTGYANAAASSYQQGAGNILNLAGIGTKLATGGMFGPSNLGGLFGAK